MKKLGILVIALFMMSMALAVPVSAHSVPWTHYHWIHNPFTNQPATIQDGCTIATLAMMMAHQGHTEHTQTVIHNDGVLHPTTYASYYNFTLNHGYSTIIENTTIYASNAVGHTPNWESVFANYLVAEFTEGDPLPVFHTLDNGAGHTILFVGLKDVYPHDTSKDIIYYLDSRRPALPEGTAYYLEWKAMCDQLTPTIGGVQYHPLISHQDHIS